MVQLNNAIKHDEYSLISICITQLVDYYYY